MSEVGADCPRHLRATLANFRSYCTNNHHSGVRLSTEKTYNTSITKYRSIRQLKIKNNREDLRPRSTLKRQQKISPIKYEELAQQIKNNHLIELIKSKLDQKKEQPRRIRTDINLKEQSNLLRTHKKVAEFNMMMAKTVKPKKQTRKKKLQLTITNTKFDLLPRKNQEKIKQIVIALQQRPTSACYIRTNVPDFQDQPKLHPKLSLAVPQKTKNKMHEVKMSRSNHLGSQLKQLSGWDIPSLDESFCNDEGAQKNDKSTKKRRKKKV